MSTQGFVRRLRVVPPRMPGGEVNLQPPPEVPRHIPGNLVMKLMPFVMIVAVVGHDRADDHRRRPRHGQKPDVPDLPDDDDHVDGRHVHGRRRAAAGKAAAELNEERKDYFSYLANLREEADATGGEQRTALEWSHPDPRALADVVGTRRMWERRPTDADYCHVRVGIGTHRLATRLLAPETGPPEDLEPVSTVALRRFVKTHSVVHALPTAVSLRAFPDHHLRGRAQAGSAIGALDGVGAVHISRTRPRAGRGGDRQPRRRELELGQVAAARPARRDSRRDGVDAAAVPHAGTAGDLAGRRAGRTRPVQPQRPADPGTQAAGRGPRRRIRHRRRTADHRRGHGQRDGARPQRPPRRCRGAAEPAAGGGRRRCRGAHRGRASSGSPPPTRSRSPRPRPPRGASAGSGPPTPPISSAWKPTRGPSTRG